MDNTHNNATGLKCDEEQWLRTSTALFGCLYKTSYDYIFFSKLFMGCLDYIFY
jgi:hypothetical protein